MGSSGQPFWRLSLRFKSPETEASFLCAKRQLLLRRLRWFFSLAATAGLAFLPMSTVHESSLLPGVGRRSEVLRTATVAGLVSMNSAFLALLCTGGKSLAATARRHFMLEAAAVLVMVVAILAVLLSAPKRLVKLQGYRLAEVYEAPYDSDSSLLLLIDGYITATHLGMPIRWHVLAPLELAAVLFYVLHVLLIGSEEPLQQVFLNCLLLTSLVLASGASKRSAEAEERRAFLQIIQEKARRCEAEFQLSQVEQERRLRLPSERSGTTFEGSLERLAARGDSEHWRIPAGDVQLLDGQPLGRGSFGEVERGVLCGVAVAVKSPRLQREDVRVHALCNEMRILRHLRHPNIVAVYGAVVKVEEQLLHLVLELITGRDLHAFILPPAGSPGVLARHQVMLGVCQALHYMHTRVPHIVHGDLKASNIMVSSSGARAVPKLLDFGLSRVLHPRAKPLGGTLRWMAPEVVRSRQVLCSSDVFSFARVLAFAATGVLPLAHSSRRAILRALRRRAEVAWPDSAAAFAALRPLVDACLQQRQERRPRIDEVHGELLRFGTKLEGGEYVEELAVVAQAMGVGAESLRERGEALASLPEDEECTPTSASSETCTCEVAQGVLRFPELAATCEPAMTAALMSTLQRWNPEMPRGSCCGRHGLCLVCKAVCAKLQALDCGEWAPGERSQCLYCGILEVRAGTCDTCGWVNDERVSL